MTIRPLRRLTIVALVTLSLLAAITAPSRAAEVRCQSVQCWKRAALWQRHDRLRMQKMLAQRLRPDVELAYRLAQGLYHVDLRRLGYCESRNDPTNRTGRYVGITQQGQDFQGRNRDVYRLVPVTNAVANVLVAARWIAAHGSSEWQCRLDGSVKHGGAYS